MLEVGLILNGIENAECYVVDLKDLNSVAKNDKSIDRDS